ncbi:MAG TPA: hypothetical protein VFE79_21840 [Paraburkholderia sp.]|jgi:hypothetical protein|nr:hypothetical protein [Paraburkholderia sp.]
MKRVRFWDLLKRGLLCALVFHSGLVFSQSPYLTRSVSNGQFVWYVTNGVVQLCSGNVCARPQTPARVVPPEAELIMLPNGGLWILTQDAAYQSFCNILPSCDAPHTLLLQTSKDVHYRYTTTDNNRLSAVHPTSGRVSWCSDTPDCVP